MFGIRLKELRQKHNMTQSEIAEILNVSTSAVSHYENETREPSEHIIVTVAKYFNVTCDYLLGMDTYFDKKEADIIKDLMDRIDRIDKLIKNMKV